MRNPIHRALPVAAGQLLAVALLAPAASAQIPKVMRYQGQVVDSQGVPLEGPYALTFRLYDAATAGVKLWEEAQTNVPLSQGYFSVLLGKSSALAPDWSKPCWLAVQVNSDAELAPRQEISSVPMAAVAEHLDGPLCTLNGRAGVGTKTANARLQVGDSGPSYYTGSDFLVAGAGGMGGVSKLVSFTDRDGPSGASIVGFERLRGSASSAGAVLAGDWLGMLGWAGQVRAGPMDTMTSATLHAVAEAPFTASSRPTSLVLSTTANGALLPAESMRITSQGYVGIGTSAPSRILTIRQFSADDPIADTWSVYQCDRTTKDILGPADGGYLAWLKSQPLYAWRRKPIVTDEEADEAVLRERKEGKADLPTGAERESKRRELVQRKAARPKFSARRVGMAIDDAGTPKELLTFDDQGQVAGIDLLGYIGYLHAALKEAALKIDQLEARVLASR